MVNADELVGNPSHSVSKFCFAKPGDTYVVYLPDGGQSDLDLQGTSGSFTVHWFNPREGGALQKGPQVVGGKSVSLGEPPADQNQDWVAIVRR